MQLLCLLHFRPACAPSPTCSQLQGHVGVYWRGGRLLPGVTQPGFRIKLPLLDTYAPIQVTIQTDKVCCWQWADSSSICACVSVCHVT